MGICVFWLPTIWHIPINRRLRRFEIKRSISDFGEETVLWIGIEHSETSTEEAQKDPNLIKRPITVKVSRGEQFSFEFELHYRNHSRNGMVVYDYTKPDNYPNAEGTSSFESFLAGICYHHIKSLFHDHEVHDDRDSGLIAYIAKNPKKFNANCINANDNEVLKYYIEQYEDNFSKYANTISRKLQTYKGILAKFTNQIGIDDNTGGVPGYSTLIKHGYRDFRRWFTDKSNIPDTERCKKDILKLSLVVHKPKIKRNLAPYQKRMENILQTYRELINAKSLPPAYDPDELKSLGNELVKTNISLAKLKKIHSEDKHRKFYRYELESLDKTLSEAEIELGIYHRMGFLYYFSHLHFFFRGLRNLDHNIPLLTENTRQEASHACEGASTEYVYCKTLLESRYNWAFRTNNFSPHAVNSRRTALNIRNSIRYIESAKYRQTNAQTISTHQTLEKAEWASKVAKKIAYASILLTAFGLGMQVNDKLNQKIHPSKYQESQIDSGSIDTCHQGQNTAALKLQANTIHPPLWNRFYGE